MTTIAGSGLPGNADGAGAQATFTEPFGVAIAKDGTIFVSDIGGQRIRAIRHGRVSTVAGGGAPTVGSNRVPGGYHDGVGQDARFNRPLGLALLPDGTLLVADAWNHCIRAIRGNVVSTLAGDPNHTGSQDGTLREATFMEPRALAVDADGTIYVADRGVNGKGGGLRKITRDGHVSTIPLPASVLPTIVGITFGQFEGHRRLYLSELDGIVALNLGGGGLDAKVFRSTAEGPRPLGNPDALLSIGDAVVFTDARTHAVRLFREPLAADGTPYSQPLNFPRPSDAMDNGGGFRDGAMRGAQFDAPRGIARDSNGDLVIADSGNRRIRRIESPDVRLPVRAPSEPSHNEEMIAFGGSALFFDTLWSTSIPGRIETATASSLDAREYDETSAASIENMLRQVTRSKAKTAVWLLTTRELDTLGERGLGNALREFAKSSPRALIALLPYSDELGGASRFAALGIGDPTEDEVSHHAHFSELERVARKSSGARMVDLVQTLQLYEMRNAEGAPFAILSPNLTDAGREVVAQQLAAAVSARGFSGGPAPINPFVAPFAVAVGSNNQIYVADPGAQRIFTWNGGAIHALAGSGSSGYRDGPLLQARFNEPLDVAVASDGSVLIADSRNHCIRKIKDGIVSTFAGSPNRTTATDGPTGKAGFVFPVGLAIDGDKVYVADYGAGVRLIDKDGTVSSPSIPGETRFVRAVAYAKDAQHENLYIVNLDRGVRSAYIYRLDTKERDNLGEFPGGAISGSIAGLSSTEILEADTPSRTVKYWYRNSVGTPFQVGYWVRLTGRDSEDDSGFGGGTQADAVAGRAFQAPTGVAVMSDGHVVVADPSARTVTVLPAVDRRHPASEDITSLELPASAYRIAFISNSMAFHKVSYAQSPGAIIQGYLNANRSKSAMPRPALVKTIMLSPIDLSSTCDYIENYLADGNFDLVVLMINGAHFRRELEYHPKQAHVPDIYQPEMAARLARTNAIVTKGGSKFVVALQPENDEASQLEGTWLLDTQDADFLKFGAAQRSENLRILGLSGVEVVDAYDAVVTSENGANRVPLFGESDEHFNVTGARIIGRAIAKGLIALHPWRQSAVPPTR